MQDNAKPATCPEVNPAPCPGCGRMCSDRCPACDYNAYRHSIREATRMLRRSRREKAIARFESVANWPGCE